MIQSVKVILHAFFYIQGKNLEILQPIDGVKPGVIFLFIGIGRESGHFFEVAVKVADIVKTTFVADYFQRQLVGDDFFAGMGDAYLDQEFKKGLVGHFSEIPAKA